MKRVALLFLVLAAPAFAADVTITAANVAPSSTARLGRGVCGETITAGQAVYLDANDSSKVKKASTASSAASKLVGISIGGCATGQEVAYATQDSDFTVGGTTTAGTIYVLSTAGGIKDYSQLASTNFTAYVGTGKAGNKLVLEPFAAGVARP